MDYKNDEKVILKKIEKYKNDIQELRGKISLLNLQLETVRGGKNQW